MDRIRACVHCGICLPQCPTYRLLGEEMDSPRGRIYLIRAAAEGRIGITATFIRHLDLCLDCRACETACPSGVPFGRLLEATRGQIERRSPRSLRRRLFDRVVFNLFPYPDRLGAALRGLSLYQRSGLQRLVRAIGLLALAPGLEAMERLLPSLQKNGSALLPELVPARGRRKGRAALLAGCVQRHLYPEINRLTIELLSLAGYEVVVPRGQGCCGALHFHAGRLEEARRFARRLISAFPEDVDYVVTNSAGCGSALKEYGDWLGGDDRAALFSSRARDVSELLAEAELPLGRLDAVATYHDPCHLAHGQKIRSEPRTLLGKIPGLKLVDLPESDLCCGSAGIYNLTEPQMADRLLGRKLDRIAETGASIVATGNPGCLLQIARGCRERELNVELLHPIELLGRSLDRGQQ